MATTAVCTSFDLRKILLEDQARLIKLLGRGDLSSAQWDVLYMCLHVVTDAIETEVWLR